MYNVGLMKTANCTNMFFFSLTALKERFLKSFFQIVRSLPYVKGYIAKELTNTAVDLEESFNKTAKNQKYVTHLPPNGMSEVKYKVYTTSPSLLKLVSIYFSSKDIKE